jgi:3-hydroxymyristoyl/3-hydroxydecanoyl-(acyl carrier protein) dehydratase
MPVIALPFAAEHPVFPGHFPGRPVVPGVLLLDWVQSAVQAHLGQDVCTLIDAKFHAPATPTDALELEFDVQTAAIRFEVRSGLRKIASGRFGPPAVE